MRPAVDLKAAVRLAHTDVVPHLGLRGPGDVRAEMIGIEQQGDALHRRQGESPDCLNSRLGERDERSLLLARVLLLNEPATPGDFDPATVQTGLEDGVADAVGAGDVIVGPPDSRIFLARSRVWVLSG